MTSDSAAGTNACRHCGLPLPRPAAEFCCSGCAIAKELSGPDGSTSPTGALLARVVVSAVLAMGVMVFSLSLYGLADEATTDAAEAMRGLQRLAAMLFSAPIFYLLGLPLYRALPRVGMRLSSDALVLAGVTAGAAVSVWNTFFDGTHVYFETVTMVLVLVSLGRWLELTAKERARDALTLLVNERTEDAVVLEPDGTERTVHPEELRVGDRVLVRPGRTIPVDGTVLEGAALVDASSLSGEATPSARRAGDRVLGGTLPTDGALVVRAEAVVGQRLQDSIEAVLEEALSRRGGLVQLADRVSAWFLPLVLLVSLGTFAWHAATTGIEAALLNALSVLLIACPCALGLATPLASWIALGDAWRNGVLVRGGDVLERLARTKRVFLDKTGTLTEPSMSLEALETHGEPPHGVARREALRLAASLESASEHVLARATLRAWDAEGERSALTPPSELRVLPGRGVEGTVDGTHVRLERADDDPSDATAVDLLVDGARVATLRFASAVRSSAREVVERFARARLAPTILSGDGERPTRRLADDLGIPYEAALLPADKAARVGAHAKGTLFVGDGLNDAAALAAADVGVAMHGASPKSLASAPVHLFVDDLRLVPFLHDLARRTVVTARWNLVWAFAYNAVGVGLAAAGRLGPVFAAAAMVASSTFVVLNSLRLRTSSPRTTVPAAERPSRPALA